MAARTATMLTLIVLLTAVITVKGAHKAAPPPVNCMEVVSSMISCIPYISNATVEKPEGDCCSGFKQVLQINPDCMCKAFQQSDQFGVTVNVTKALSLPSACNVSPPSTSFCGLSVPPAGAPAGVISPAGTPSTGTPSTAKTPSPATPAAPPSESGPKSGSSSSSFGVSINLIIAGLAAALFISF